MRKHAKVVTGVLGIILVISLLLWRYNLLSKQKPEIDGSSHTVEVVLTKEGFVPEDITVELGDTVKFVTTAGKPFWPASDPHPTHTIEAGFDPRQPVEPESSWSYTFEKIGDWKYHDHLFFTYKGIVHVVEKGLEASTNLPCNEQNAKCWEDQIQETLETKGLDSAFDLLANLYATQAEFAVSCHGNAHTLGEEAYKLFAQKKEVELTSKTSYCGYGFYHGFMETLLQTSGNIQEAKDFCLYVGKKLSADTTDAEGACYHGIGHGTVDGSDPTAWGNVEKMLHPGMVMCEKVAGDDRSEFGKLYRCVSGAYNALEILSGDSKYRLLEIQKNPFSICPSQPNEFLEACHTNMLPALLRFTNNDILKSARYIESIQGIGLSVRSQTMLSLTHEYIRMNLQEKDYAVSAGVDICRKLTTEMRLPCVEGLSGGHMKYGDPKNAYEKGIGFCNSSLLRTDERNVCFKFILPRLRVWYSKEKTAEICDGVPSDAKKYCSQ